MTRAFVVALLSALSARHMSAQGVAEEIPTTAAAERHLYDVVFTAVVGGGRAVIMASLARPRSGVRSFLGLAEPDTSQWRFRLLPLRPPHQARSLVLTGDGTKAMVVTGDRVRYLVDLTQKILEIPQHDSSAPPRYLEQWLAYTDPDGKVAVVRDSPFERAGRPTSDADDCLTGILSIAQLSEQVWTLSRTGTVCGGTIDSDGSLPLRVLVRLTTTNAVLVTRDVDVRVLMLDRTPFASVDPVTGEAAPLTGARTAAEALLRVVGGFPSNADGKVEASTRRLAHELTPQAIRYLQDRSFVSHDVGAWSAWTISPNALLYAPSLEFAAGEPVLPTSVDKWKAINDEVASSVDSTITLDWKARTEATFAAYQRLGLNEGPCAIYTATRSYPGSWVHEYWTYYPFDIGQGSHFHDTEHVFVEVDKLGGTVHQIIGAAHGVWASNNIYKAASPSAAPATLPIHTIAEFGKHASAPDVNRDYRFTIGVDVNTFRDKAKIWGIRDTTALTDANLRGYDGTMVLERRPENTWHPTRYREFFPTMPDAVDERLTPRTCQLLPFPPVTSEPCSDRHWNASLEHEYGPSQACAVAVLNDDGDYQIPTRALKRAYAPAHTLRYSYGWRPQIDGRGGLGPAQRLHTFGGYGDISWMKFIPEPIRAPGRVSVDVLLPEDFFRPAAPSRIAGFQVRYERLVSNLSGFYGGASWTRDPAHDGREPSLLSDHYRPWLDVGGLFEFAPFLHLNFGCQGGLSYTNGAGAGLEFRIVGALLQQGKFGIRRQTPSSY